MRPIISFRAWLVVLACGLLAVPAWAGQGKAAAQAKKAAHAAEVKAFAPVVAELHQIKALLDRANRDYAGHRAKAVEAISAAIKALPHHHSKGTSGAGGGEAQALSDAQLQEAIKALGVVEAQLASSSSKHAARAIGHINQAGKEIQVALTIK
jgi:hypothetical protein